MNDELKVKLAAILGVSMDSTDSDLLATVSDLVALRQRIEAGAKLEQRIAGVMRVTNCTRETALGILAAQDRAGA